MWLLVLIVLGGALALLTNPVTTPVQGGGVACTMEAKLCPDGSYVGRTGPNCEFAACPIVTPASGTAGAHCGGFIQNAPTCNAGLHCQLNVSMPDTGGVCVADSTGGGGGILPQNSGIQGTVMLGPTCPVEQIPPNSQCADRPYATQVSVARAVDPTHPVTVVQSDAQGAFQVTLSPGDYIVSAAGGNMLPRCSPVSATVSPNVYASVAVSCDTGIR
jgi:hypothetical protein